MVQAGALLEVVKAFCRPLAGHDEWPIPFIDIRGDEAGAVRVGSLDDERGHSANIGREASRTKVALVGGSGDEHLPAEMPALLFRGELVLEMHGCCASLDVRLHDL